MFYVIEQPIRSATSSASIAVTAWRWAGVLVARVVGGAAGRRAGAVVPGGGTVQALRRTRPPRRSKRAALAGTS